MLPPIEFFMGMLAGGILGYLIAIFISSGSEEAASNSASKASQKTDWYDPSAAGTPCSTIHSSCVMFGGTTNSGGRTAISQPTAERSNRTKF
jgi:hypothetical protein